MIRNLRQHAHLDAYGEARSNHHRNLQIVPDVADGSWGKLCHLVGNLAGLPLQNRYHRRESGGLKPSDGPHRLLVHANRTLGHHMLVDRGHGRDGICDDGAGHHHNRTSLVVVD